MKTIRVELTEEQETKVEPIVDAFYDNHENNMAQLIVTQGRPFFIFGIVDDPRWLACSIVLSPARVLRDYRRGHVKPETVLAARRILEQRYTP